MSLNDNFRAKLGHHIGQIYSRVGTDDWVPNHSSERDFNERAKRYADSLCQWVEDADLKAVEKMYAKLQPPLKNKADFLDFFEANRPKKRKERVISRVTEILEDSSLIEQKTIDKIKILLTNDSALTSDLL
jgi:hypothetical protein